MSKRLLTGALVVLLSVAGLPAQSHSQLVDVTPRPNQSVASAKAITLTFNEELIDLGGRSNVITVTDSRNRRVSVSATQVASNTLIATVNQKLAPGRYTVWWRAVSADGHPVSGNYRFTVRR